MAIIEASIDNAKVISEIISIANYDVAQRFNLNYENCPKHSSFCTEDWILKDFSRGVHFFLYKVENNFAGCVSFEKTSENVSYLNRLAVLPNHRKCGIGEKLVGKVFEFSKSKEIKTLSIGIISQNIELKKWYIKLGFVEYETKSFIHLPFDVTYMRYSI